MPNKFVGAFKFLTQGARKGKVAPTITQPRQLKTTMKRIQSENQRFGFTKAKTAKDRANIVRTKKSFESFKTWVQSKINKKVDKLKSERGKQKAIEAGEAQIASINDASQDIINVFNLSKLLAEAKLIFVRKYNNAVYNTKHFKEDGKGGLAVTAPEGYVAIDRFGDGVKLVDRLEFSRANFAMDKGFAK